MSATGPDSRSTSAPPGTEDRIAAGDAPGTPEVTRYARRAEAPPPQYWRRWHGDAPGADVAGADVAGADVAGADVAGADVAGDAVAGNAPVGDTPSAAIDNAPAVAGDASFPRAKPIASAVSSALATDSYRILIVEDDPSQALFAEGVLKGTGMETMIVGESSGVIDALERFHPDLVLMDLHIPGLDGLAMTAQIRAHEEFLHTPIVFLTGDPDPDRQFEVLAGGADDFLNKPIRPRHLVAAVQSRVQRARKLSQSRMRTPQPSAETGLLPRAVLIEQLANALRQPAVTGAVLFIEIAGAARLRERYGYAAYENVLAGAGVRLAELAPTLDAGSAAFARLNDSAFLVLAPGLASARIEEFARTLRDGLAGSSFGTTEQAIRLRATLGAVDLGHGFDDVGAVLDAAESALRGARESPAGLKLLAPMQRSAADNPALGEVVREALKAGRLELAYQPIVAVAGGDDAQYQTLLRLRTEDGQLQSAGQFLPALEDTALLHELDHWVLEQAVATLRRRGAEHRPLRLFVSQSPRSLSRPASAEWLLDAIATQRIEGTSLVIDLRLSDALIHTVTLLEFCQRLMGAGVQFCLSQYEQSEEAQSLLAQLPLGYLRLSSRYSEAQASPALRDEMRAVIDRAHRLGLQVIGHQIEDPQAAATLWMSGIDYIQGNLVQVASEDLEFDFQSAVL